MKIILIALLFICSQNIFAQFEEIDRHVKNTPKHLKYDIDALTKHLTQNAKSDLQKVRILYTWLAYNIAYDVDEYKSIIKKGGEIRYAENLDQLDKSIIKNTLINKKAVCEGYALSFQAMCEKAGVECFLISGYAKNTRRESSSIADHAWNVAFVDGKWRLFDVTWGAGNVVNDSYYEANFTDKYFDTPADIMILNHLPSDPIWQLLENPISYEIFIASESDIKQSIKNQNHYFAFNDSIRQLLTYSTDLQALISAENAYRYNEKNAEDLGYAWNNYAVKLSNQTISMDAANVPITKILEINEMAIQAQRKAVEYTKNERLKEGLGIFYLNHAKYLQDKGYREAKSQQYNQAIASYSESLNYTYNAREIYGDNKSIYEAEGTSYLNIGFVYSTMANNNIQTKQNYDLALSHYQQAKKLLSKANTGLARQNLRTVEQNIKAVKHNRSILGL